MTTPETTVRAALRNWRNGALFLAALLLAVAVQPAGAQGDARKKLDQHLRERLAAGEDGDTPVKVIVTVRPGARKGLVQKLHGARRPGDVGVQRHRCQRCAACR